MGAPGRSAGVEDVAAAVARAAARLTAQHVQALAAFLTDQPGPAAAVAAGARSLVAAAHFRDEVDALLVAWRQHPEVTGQQVGFGLLAAFASVAQKRAAERVELVATGPRTWLVPVRSSEEVLLDLIGRSRRRLLVVSFATFRVPSVRAALVGALDRGVAVTMLMEDAELGELRAANAYADLAPRVRMLAWPAQQRGGEGALRPKMHAKAAVVDGEIAFITSANLTGAGLEHNMELGTLITGGDVPVTLERHVTELQRSGVLVAAG